MAIVQPPPLQNQNGAAAHYNMGYVWAISFVAAMGGLLFGYDWVVIGGAKIFYEKFFRITAEMLHNKEKAASLSGWINSCALLGCLLGSLISGILSDKFGRKRLLLLSGVLFAVSSLLTGAASTFNVFVFWRIIGGAAIGLASNLSPMYIAEVSPTAMRGRLVAVNQLTIVIGILAAQIINWRIGHGVPAGATEEWVRQSWYGQHAWRWMFYAVVVPSVLFFALTLFVPESPRWLIKNGRDSLAQRILARIGGEQYGTAEVAQIRATLACDEIQHVRFSDLLDSRVMKILLIGMALAILQQWCGINVIFNYAEEIFKYAEEILSKAGYNYDSTFIGIVVSGTVNLVFTLVAMAMVDRFGRRILMLAGCGALVVTHSLIGLSIHLHLSGMRVMVPVMASLACYALSLAPVTWVLISEIFPNRIRGAAVSIAVSALWIACFILTFTFPMLNARLGAAMTFWLYAAICAVGFVFILLKVPETKGKTLEQIEKELTD